MKEYTMEHLQKEFFLSKKYEILGDALTDTEHSTIYQVRCLCLENTPTALLKIYHNRDLTPLYHRLQQINFDGWSKIFDSAYFAPDTYIVEELLSGMTLESYLLLRQQMKLPLSNTEIIQILSEICNTLEFMHRLQPPVIHRDLKPSNIFLQDVLRENWRRASLLKLKLIDFDVAREYVPGQERDTQFLGTRQYASPEQLGVATLGQTDARSDIYSMGILLYEMLYQTYPSNHDLERLNPKLPFSIVILTCTSLLPQQRYQSARALQKALQAQAGSTDLATPAVLLTVKKSVLSIDLKSKYFWNPFLNPLPLGFVNGALPALITRFSIIDTFVGAVFWISLLYLIVKRSQRRGQRPGQIPILNSVFFWILYFVFVFVFFLGIGFFISRF